MAGFGRGGILGLIFRWMGGGEVTPASGATYATMGTRRELHVDAGTRDDLAPGMSSRRTKHVAMGGRRTLSVTVGSHPDLHADEGTR